MSSTLNENKVKEKILKLRSGNTLLSIIPEVGGSITRYCLKTEEYFLELMRTIFQVRFFIKDLLEIGCFPLIPFSKWIKTDDIRSSVRRLKCQLTFYQKFTRFPVKV